MAKGKYRLMTQHYFPGDLLLEPNTVVGDGTPYPVIGAPSLQMEPLDDASVEEINAWNRLRHRPEQIGLVPGGLAPGPGQIITQSAASGPPRNEGRNRVAGPPGYNEGAPVIAGTPITEPGLTPTEQKIEDERQELKDKMAAEAKEISDINMKRLAERREAAAKAAGLEAISAEEAARRAAADKAAAADAVKDREAAAAVKAAPIQPAKA